MFHKRQLLYLAAGFFGTLLVCGVGGALAWRQAARAAATPTPPDVAAILTQAVLTSQAFVTATPPTTGSPSSTMTPTSPGASATSPATATVGVPPSPTPRCLAAGFVQDVTVPDGSEFAPNATFTKTWRLINRGTCTWTPSFQLFFVKGERLGAPESVNLPRTVPPGDMVDISVAMQAPAAPGEYQGFWKLRSDKGIEFGVGDDAARSVWVLIRVVVTPTPTATASATTAPATPSPTATPAGASPTPTPAPPTATPTPAPPTATPTPTPLTPTPTHTLPPPP